VSFAFPAKSPPNNSTTPLTSKTFEVNNAFAGIPAICNNIAVFSLTVSDLPT
jgi:hypothetical protein